MVTYENLAYMLFFPTMAILIWAAKQKGRWMDTINLQFRKSRCVKVNFHTASGRNIERFIIPDGQGFMRINGGVYKFEKEFAEINQRHRIPEVDVLESQITPPSPDVGSSVTEVEVEQLQSDGTVVKVKKEVPTFFLTYKRQIPKRTNELWAQEVARFADSNIVADITTATARVMKILEWTFYITLLLLAVTVLGFFVVYSQVGDVKDLITIFMQQQAANNGGAIRGI